MVTRHDMGNLMMSHLINRAIRTIRCFVFKALPSVKALEELGRPQCLAGGLYGIRLGGKGVYEAGKASK
jgi:hypothetical protein